MAKTKKGKGRRVSLAAFLRKLWSKPDLMERFSLSRAGRQSVLSEFNLSAKHSRLLLDGCVNDIIAELAGGKKAGMTNTAIINCDHGGEDCKCGHPECKAFMGAVASQPRRKPKKKR